MGDAMVDDRIRIAVLGLGAMGSAVASRLITAGVDVLTVFDGRSEASRQRAIGAGISAGAWADLAEVEIVLSIVPPAQATSVAAAVVAIPASKPGRIFADCNAVSPQTMSSVASLFANTTDRVVDASIIGAPPKDGHNPVIYVSGPGAPALLVLKNRGLDLRAIEGPIGAASALKMSYAGITKGLTALGAAMMLAATRSGAAADLAAELSASQPQLLAWLAGTVPGMLPKAYRFDGEMMEIADFIGDATSGAGIYEGMAELYRTLARDRKADGQAAEQLLGFVAMANKLRGVGAADGASAG
jgi:3-hydroxyisobutyrate dehydrogenase-like beta-hydroxyacid dehydrogenase